MLHVDNSGKGNCMYYAYSISLMYFLRAKNTPAVTEDIFNKLKLKEEDRVPLRTLLAKIPTQEFSPDEIKSIIEPILGRATRNLAAEHTVSEFKSSPQDSPLFATAKYGLEYFFKQALESNGWQLASLIPHEFTHPDYTEAEIYKVKGMDTAMQDFVAERLPEVIAEFKRQWDVKEQEFVKQKKQLSPKDIQAHKKALFDQIMKNETIEFFTTNDYKHLNVYKDHLQKDFVWGSEETLLTLHRAIQGERFVRNIKGTVDPIYDHEIVLHLQRNGNSPFIQAGIPRMILNNQNNVHWTSKIPDSVFAPKPTIKEPSDFAKQFPPVSKTTYPSEIAFFIRENKQSGPRVAKILKQMYQYGLDGNKKYSPEYCRNIAQQYLNYVRHNNRRFDVTGVLRFLDEMNAIIDKAKKSSVIAPSYKQVVEQGITPQPLPGSEQKKQVFQDDKKPNIEAAVKENYFEKEIADSAKDKVKDQRFVYPYSDGGTALLFRTIYDWTDSLKEKSFEALIKSTLKKYEATTWGSYWGASRRKEVEGYLYGNSNAKALAMIFMNGQVTSALNECLFVKIIEIIKKEICKHPSLLQEQGYVLINQFNLDEQKATCLANLKQHSETISASHRQLELASSLTCSN